MLKHLKSKCCKAEVKIVEQAPIGRQRATWYVCKKCGMICSLIDLIGDKMKEEFKLK